MLNAPSDQLGPADLLTVWLPAACLPVLPPHAPGEGEEGSRQARGWTGNAGAQPRREAPQQRPRCRGGLEAVSQWRQGVGTPVFCLFVCLLNEHQQSVQKDLMLFFLCFIFDVFSVVVFADVNFTHRKPEQWEESPCFPEFPGDLGTIKCHHHFLAAYLFCLGFFFSFWVKSQIGMSHRFTRTDRSLQCVRLTISQYLKYCCMLFFQLLSPLTPKNYVLQYWLTMRQTEVLNTYAFL